MRFQNRMRVLFANWPFLKVQCSKLCIGILSSQAFALSVGSGGGFGR